MKIGFYNQYLHSLSGGERYVLSLASHWSKLHEVDIFWHDKKIRSDASKRFDIDLSRVQIVPNVFGGGNIFKKMLVSKNYDVIFFLTDGSIPTTFAKHNILHFQVPFQSIKIHTIKLRSYQAIVCNSLFTKNNLISSLGKMATVIYPPVKSVKLIKIPKKKIILSVGRFHHLKKQDFLINCFIKGNFSGYELILAGGSLPADSTYVQSLRKKITGFPIQLIENPTYNQIERLYNEATIFWHGAGYGETDPQRMEHFGITVVEAMSLGVVPIVFNGGGLPEIVRDNTNGFLWNDEIECISKTNKLLHSPKLRLLLGHKAKIQSNKFNEDKFTSAFDSLLLKITQ